MHGNMLPLYSVFYESLTIPLRPVGLYLVCFCVFFLTRASLFAIGACHTVSYFVFLCIIWFLFGCQ